MSDGFLGRWSRRKLDARDGRPLPEEPPEAAAARAPVVSALPAAAADPAPAAVVAQPPAPAAEVPVPAADEPPPPTMDDVQALTAESDFSRFATRDVAADVKNAAMKKLFADPRYNVMDGMDVYIDDYSRPDPMPDSMLRQLASASFLRLFDEPPGPPEAGAQPGQPRDVADNHAARSVAQSTTVSDAAAAPPNDADPDLRLQQDDAPAAGGPGQGAA
ncbi:DUF3306 domain-containing protein [Ramlibacter sp. RBP-2]|uniref:DUF3306 domain-containing protein n=1 Tax=Ramlibacter lithotrophicus TaxID=2606681 RepID=A0A7X6I7G9_9BURK|nr:DUF3306 domain-containing protein [Ramlibacter lithotrophicus]NKE67209.1 DUF3306 domain-containing protein [Ramlibacter lithotrophicus]